MSDQLPCPNCGGYKYDGNHVLLDPITHKKITVLSPGCLWLLLVVIWTVLSIFSFTKFGDQVGYTVMFISIPIAIVAAIWISI